MAADPAWPVKGPQPIVRDVVLSHLIVSGIATGLRIDSGESVDDSAEEYGWPGGATLVIPLR